MFNHTCTVLERVYFSSGWRDVGAKLPGQPVGLGPPPQEKALACQQKADLKPHCLGCALGSSSKSRANSLWYPALWLPSTGD